jgi:hypothetical protein
MLPQSKSMMASFSWGVIARLHSQPDVVGRTVRGRLAAILPDVGPGHLKPGASAVR